MTGKQRVMNTFQRKPTDRVPMWCGASPEFMAKARAYLGVTDDEGVLERFHDDFRRVYSRYVGPERFDPVKNAQAGKNVSPFGVERHGIGYGQPISHPLMGASLEQIHAYPWPSPDWYDVSHIREDALGHKGQYAVMGGEWSPFFHDTVDLLGMENMMILMYEEPEVVRAVMTHIVDFYLALSERIFKSAADVMDIFFIGNDFGSQTGPLLGTELFSQFISPQLKRLTSLGHSYGLKVMMHCCGSFHQLIPLMVEAGLDGVQSLQPGTRGMDPAFLKETYGDKIVLNGCVDSIDVLIKGDTAKVEAVTRQTVELMKRGGGYILSPSHDYLLEETPVENVVKLYDVGLEWGGY